MCAFTVLFLCYYCWFSGFWFLYFNRVLTFTLISEIRMNFVRRMSCSISGFVKKDLVVPPEGKVYSLEKSIKFAQIAQENFKKYEVSDRINLIIGDASKSLEHLCQEGHSGTFDFSYIDADKTNYPTYFNLSLQLLRQGGVLAVDNTLFKGKVFDLDNRVGQQIDNANKTFISSGAVDVLLLNIGDGYTLMRKR
ncbi:probable caffeoyl-CoA O-methyltransferase 2 isoform X2 [Eurytemora carolleeae]|uniref:probable caffeoyl-CoA O-methyltransferase 2 isoform X2 n=1 Tax=Eurytemora carolleeae TaxID=1294199 RepID=UPI000C76C1D6|nr:probable caffeoyl-CoA O-methyltransferase 2 isoform X2 [Eurytemora carolleeae]|eukprot:XP_023342530.1 probable caffeoyl-CoA O-methyltransferase 2 isoform X2 [Eurytemora affinis]